MKFTNLEKKNLLHLPTHLPLPLPFIPLFGSEFLSVSFFFSLKSFNISVEKICWQWILSLFVCCLFSLHFEGCFCWVSNFRWTVSVFLHFKMPFWYLFCIVSNGKLEVIFSFVNLCVICPFFFWLLYQIFSCWFLAIWWQCALGWFLGVLRSEGLETWTNLGKF